jgi:hypothetical protein
VSGLPEGTPGLGLIRASWWTTGVFVVAATAAAVAPDAVARPVAVLDVVLFVVGTVLFLVAFARAVGRSREEQIDIMGVYFLGGGVAPRDVRRHLLGSFAVQVLVAVVTASIRPYTSVAFGILVPMLGLGLAGLWGATYGTFPPRGAEPAHAIPAPEDEAD